MRHWASRPLGTSASDFLAAIRSEIPVSLISTPRAEFRCQRRSRWRTIENDAHLADFDQVPITNGDGDHIEAVFLRGTGLVELREFMFMASDAPLFSFLESADEQTFRFLLEDRSVSGLVTLSDVQKLPVYSILFGLVIAVEMLLMEWIRKVCGANQDEWLDHLSIGQRQFVEKHWKEAVKKNVAIDRLSCASFGQEVRAAFGLGLFNGHEERRKSVQALEELRHQVCHAVEFAPTPVQALRLPHHVRDAESLAAWLQSRVEALLA